MEKKTIVIIEDQVESMFSLDLLFKKFNKKYDIETIKFMGAKKQNVEYIKMGIIKDTLASEIYLNNGKVIDAFEEYRLYFEKNPDKFKEVDLFLVDLRVNGVPGGVFAKHNIIEKGKAEEQVIFYSACIEEDRYYQESLKCYGKNFKSSFYSKLDISTTELLDIISKKLSKNQ